MTSQSQESTSGRFFARPDSAIGDLRTGWQLTAREFIVWIIFVVITFVLVCHHEYWRDEAQGYLLARDLSLPGLFAHMQKESQFILWYLFSWPFVHICGFSIFALGVVHWVMSCATAWMIIRYAPFRLWSKAGIIFSMAYAFEYTVITRHYQIGIFLLVLLLIFWKYRYKHPIPYACLMALSASANLPYWGCLSALCAVIFGECIVGRKTGQSKGKIHFDKTILAAMGIVLLGYCLAALEIYNWDGGFGSKQIVDVSQHDVTQEPLRYLYHALYFYGKVLILAPNISEETGYAYFIIYTGIAVTIFTLIYFSRNWRAMLFFAVNSAIVLALMYIGQFHSTRHVSFLLIGAIAACWIDSVSHREDAATDSVDIIIRKESPARHTITVMGGFLAGFLMIEQVIAFLLFGCMEIAYPFSHGRATADYIKKNYQENILIGCFCARQNVPVMAYLPQQFFIFDRGEFGTFSKWGKIKALSMIQMSNIMFEAFPKGNDAFLLLVSSNERPTAVPPNFQLVYSSADHEKKTWSPYGEAFYLYEVVRPELLNVDPNHFTYRDGPAHMFVFPSESSAKLRFH